MQLFKRERQLETHPCTVPPYCWPDETNAGVHAAWQRPAR
jgi:hypothetical protein